MRVSLLAIAGGVGFTYAQFPGVPSCAVPCVLKFTSGSSIAGCNNLDVSCICANQSFISNIACCLVSVCDEADQQAATAYADQICKANGVIVPTAVSCTSSLITSTSSTPSSAPSSTATAAEVTTSSSNGSVSSQVTTHTSSSASSSTGSSTSSSTTAAATKNAGTQNVAGLGAGIWGGLAAAAALL